MTSTSRLSLDSPSRPSESACQAKLGVDLPGARLLADRCSRQDAEAVAELLSVRRDPFDRLLAATALRRNWTLVSRDRGFAELAVPTLWLT